MQVPQRKHEVQIGKKAFHYIILNKIIKFIFKLDYEKSL
jgi:hypothetical protein